MTARASTGHRSNSRHTPFIRVPEIAAALELSRGRVYALISEGKIPAVRSGRRIRIPRAAFEAWVRSAEQRALENLREPVDGVTAAELAALDALAAATDPA